MAESQYVTVHDSKVHYLTQGSGDPILFLHGVPTSSYLWRHIIPKLATGAHCFAPDLIGMGYSDKPNIAYTLFDHIKYIDRFIEQLQLTNITLVMHGLGSAIGFDYAMRNPDKVKALAFYEAHVRPTTTWDMLSLPIQDFLLPIMSDESSGYQQIMQNNILLEKVLPTMAMRQLDGEVLATYNQPFKESSHRQPLWQYLQDFATGKESHEKVVSHINNYSQKLTSSAIPKLMLYSTPGYLTTMDTVNWCKNNIPNLRTVDLEEGLHLAQESNPNLFATLLHDWYKSL